MTEYTDPSTIDVDVVRSEIDHSFRVKGHLWDETATWPNVTVKAMSDRIAELEQTSPNIQISDRLQQASADFGLPVEFLIDEALKEFLDNLIDPTEFRLTKRPDNYKGQG